MTNTYLLYRLHSRKIVDDQPFVQSNAILLQIAKHYNVLGGQNDELLNHCTEWLFWEANKIGLCLPQLRASAKFESARLSEGAHDWLYARYQHDVGMLNNEPSDGRAFILGDTVTIADCSLCGYLFFADEAEIEVPEHVQAWLDTIAALEGWAHPYHMSGNEL